MKGMAKPMEDKDWQAQSDALDLMRAKEVMSDPARRRAAKAAALKLADEKMEEAKNMKKAARGMGTPAYSGMEIPAELKAEGWNCE